MHWIAIVNPASGGGLSTRVQNQINKHLSKLTSEIYVTKYPGHATELVQAHSTAEAIAIVGGDGTLFECLGGINGDTPRLSIIPSGTGNSLAQDMGILTWRQGISNCLDGVERTVDTIGITYLLEDGRSARCHCASTTGLGYPSNAVVLGNRRLKKLGRYCYPVSGVIQSFLGNRISGNILIDDIKIDASDLKGIFINNTQFAGNFRAFPEAEYDDGLFDVLCMHVGPLRQNLQNILVLNENYSYMPSHNYRAKKLHIELDTPLPLMLDGEIIEGVVDVKFVIESKAITCIIPNSTVFNA